MAIVIFSVTRFNTYLYLSNEFRLNYEYKKTVFSSFDEACFWRKFTFIGTTWTKPNHRARISTRQISRLVGDVDISCYLFNHDVRIISWKYFMFSLIRSKVAHNEEYLKRSLDRFLRMFISRPLVFLIRLNYRKIGNHFAQEICSFNAKSPNFLPHPSQLRM